MNYSKSFKPKSSSLRYLLLKSEISNFHPIIIQDWFRILDKVATHNLFHRFRKFLVEFQITTISCSVNNLETVVTKLRRKGSAAYCHHVVDALLVFCDNPCVFFVCTLLFFESSDCTEGFDVCSSCMMTFVGLKRGSLLAAWNYPSGEIPPMIIPGCMSMS